MSDPVIYLTPLLSIVQTKNGWELRANAGTHSVCIGTAQTAERALKTAERLERYPANVRDFANV